MYKFLIKIVKFIASIFRLIQVLGILYVVLHIIYWFMQLGHVKSVFKYTEYFVYFQSITDSIINNLPALKNPEFELFYINTIINIAIDIFVLVIYNFIFFITDFIEEKLLARGYEIGEISDLDLPYNKQ